MKIKSGKQLTQLEIIKRLNLMGIKYDPTIIGKNYFINLYDKEILSPTNQQKIQNELEKDRKYQEYFHNILRKTKEYSLQYLPKENNHSNDNKKYIFDDFNMKLCSKTLICYGAFNLIGNNKKLAKRYLFPPLKAFNRFKTNILYPEINRAFKAFLNFIDKINLDAYHYLCIFIFICLAVILLLFSIKIRKQNSSNIKKGNP